MLNRFQLRRTSAAAGVFVLMLPLAAYGQNFQTGRHAQPLIHEVADESRLATLEGSTRPEAVAENDRGRVPDEMNLEHLMLQLRRSPEQEAAVVRFVDDLHNPSSPNFHHWLTAEEFGERFGASSEDIAKISTWLRSQGLRVNRVYPGGMTIDFSGTARQVTSAFRTEIHQLRVGNTNHIANMSDPKIPEALAPAIAGIVSLHDFMPHPMMTPKANYTVGSGTFALVPEDLATIYNFTPIFNGGNTGQGQTIAVIEDTNVYSTADWTTFRSTLGLSGFTSGSFTQIHPGGCTNPGVNGDDGEAILDAEWASAAAPSANIVLASCANTLTTFGGLIAMHNLLSAPNPPAIMSVSYGECEPINGAGSNAAYSAVYQQAVAMGVSVFVSAGDEGAASCDANATTATHGIAVSGFASTPYNVAVGGTDFSDTFTKSTATYWNSSNDASFGSAKSYVPEIPWNDSCASILLAYAFGYTTTAGSSGFCNSVKGQTYFLTTASGSGGPSGCASGIAITRGVVSGTCAGTPKPSWQTGVVGIPADGVRDLPDVSLFAANGVWGHYFVYCYSDPSQQGSAPCTGAPSGWSGAGGTSFSAPILAGVQALVNQKKGASQGNPNYVYYSLAATEYGTTGTTTCKSNNGTHNGGGCIFYDITSGDMDVNCRGSHNCYTPSGTNGVLATSKGQAYGTGTGWDFATGIGSVNVANLVNNW